MRGIPGASQVLQAYFPGSRLSETVRSWQARAGQRPVVQAREANKGHAFLTPPNFLKGHAQGGGQPLPAVVKSQMESFFQTDFSKVRVHVGPQAPSIGALAFTVGTDLYFAPGQYQPNTAGGRQLIGHELTHVVQQAQGRVANPYGSGMAVVHDPGLEEEAERMGKLAAQHRGRGKPTGAQVQRATMGMAAGEKPRGVQRAGGYKLVIGTYLHPKAAQLPEPLAGHSFVSIVQPDGNKKTYGFSPAHYGSYDPRRDLSKLRAGVPGVVHSDEDALSKPGVKVREYDIAPSQAQAAMAKVEEYRSGKHRYNLTNRQCSTFALDVLRAAKVEEPSSTAASRPRDIYRQLPGWPQIQRAAIPRAIVVHRPTGKAEMAMNPLTPAVALVPHSVPTAATPRTGGRGSVADTHESAVRFPRNHPVPPRGSQNRGSAIQPMVAQKPVVVDKGGSQPMGVEKKGEEDAFLKLVKAGKGKRRMGFPKADRELMNNELKCRWPNLFKAVVDHRNNKTILEPNYRHKISADDVRNALWKALNNREPKLFNAVIAACGAWSRGAAGSFGDMVKEFTSAGGFSLFAKHVSDNANNAYWGNGSENSSFGAKVDYHDSIRPFGGGTKPEVSEKLSKYEMDNQPFGATSGKPRLERQLTPKSASLRKIEKSIDQIRSGEIGIFAYIANMENLAKADVGHWDALSKIAESNKQDKLRKKFADKASTTRSESSKFIEKCRTFELYKEHLSEISRRRFTQGRVPLSSKISRRRFTQGRVPFGDGIAFPSRFPTHRFRPHRRGRKRPTD